MKEKVEITQDQKEGVFGVALMVFSVGAIIAMASLSAHNLWLFVPVVIITVILTTILVWVSECWKWLLGD